MPRAALIRDLARRIAALVRPHPLRIGIDGVDAAGKTTLADELVRPLEALGRPVIRASIDGFHHPRTTRYERGRLSPEGYFLDSFDMESVRSVLLEPLGPSGSRRYCTAAHDWRSDTAVERAWSEASEDAVLLFDGVFLHRPELRSYWDATAYLDIPPDVSIRRGLARLAAESPDADLIEAERHYRARYVPGQKLYLSACDPVSNATWVIDNVDLEHPVHREV